MRRRELLWLAGGGVAAAQSRGGGWELYFARVWERVEVRLDGPRGPLIRVEGPPCGGATWCAAAGQGGIVLDRWVGDARVIRLYARVVASRGPSQCNVEVRYRGRVFLRWSFSNEEFREIVR